MRGAPDAILRLPQRAKKKYQADADLAGAFGSACLGRVGYEQRLGLWLNCHRAECRRAIGIVTGLGSVFSGGLTPELADALADSDDEAVNLKAESAARIAESRRTNANDIDLDEML